MMNEPNQSVPDSHRWRRVVGGGLALVAATIAVALAVDAVALLREPWNSGKPEDIKRGWDEGNRREVADDIAANDLMVDWPREHVLYILGDQGPLTDDRDYWSSWCSDPGCYSLTVNYNEDGRVTDAISHGT